MDSFKYQTGVWTPSQIDKYYKRAKEKLKKFEEEKDGFLDLEPDEDSHCCHGREADQGDQEPERLPDPNFIESY